MLQGASVFACPGILMFHPIRSLLLPHGYAIVAIALGTTLALVSLWARPAESLAACVLSYSLAWASVVDIKRFILPDLLTFGLIVIGLFFRAPPPYGAFLSHLAGAALGYSLVWLVNWWFKRVRKRQGIGMGDAKLFAAAGAWTGLEALPAVILIASLVGIAAFVLIGICKQQFDSDRPLPFGPSIAAALWATWTFG